MSDTKEAVPFEESGLIVTQPGEVQKTNPASDAAAKELADAVKAEKSTTQRRGNERERVAEKTAAPAKKTAAPGVPKP